MHTFIRRNRPRTQRTKRSISIDGKRNKPFLQVCIEPIGGQKIDMLFSQMQYKKNLCIKPDKNFIGGPGRIWYPAVNFMSGRSKSRSIANELRVLYSDELAR